MTIKQAIVWATKKLKTSTSPNLDAEVLLSYVIEKPREYLYTHPQSDLNLLQKIKFKKNIAKRALGIPVAYITNVKEFFGFDFFVDKNVLVPRPETELLIEEVIKIRGQRSEIRDQKLTIADIGTGSGCIAVTLAKELPSVRVIATDISKPALQVAKKNARLRNVNIKFFQGDLLEPIKNQKLDIIIANLPYGWKQWKNNTSAETLSLQFEPQDSLFTKNDGLYLYERLFGQIAKLKYKPKFILGEFDPRQTKKMNEIIKKHLPDAKVEIKKDLAGLDRLLIIKFVDSYAFVD